MRRGKITWPDLSELARRDDVAVAMWRISEVLVGMSDAPCPDERTRRPDVAGRREGFSAPPAAEHSYSLEQTRPTAAIHR
ncbi:hypothetical protein BQ8482_160064 [Mesorhizobium delmotii]|uniref:Uncharacterized protein n=1 Tax=Mesorhizobium delmotii TaxID=1631247 RepID=A0A2P9AHJ7_9HYPH|nr:hypothetical protein BQ8482_160064 [Mesorhizobium delmotii]